MYFRAYASEDLRIVEKAFNFFLTNNFHFFGTVYVYKTSGSWVTRKLKVAVDSLLVTMLTKHK